LLVPFSAVSGRTRMDRGTVATISSHGEITTLLHAWTDGDAEALAKLISLVYEQLHCAALRHMAWQRSGHILQGTALVNEVYLRLSKLGHVKWRERSHFFAVCARLMRHVLIDHVRTQLRQKRGGEIVHVSMDEIHARPEFSIPEAALVDLVALDDALNRLAEVDERKSRVVDLRFFGGLSAQETAEVLNVSEDTVGREWKFAKYWLLCELGKGSKRGK
jgi:RNA polymerase sigma factor (TIGR02999 family)